MITELRVVEGELSSLRRDQERIERELAGTAAARAEHEQLGRELASYPTLLNEFQRLEALAREEGRRQTLLEAQQSLAAELARLRERRDRVESAPRLDAEVSAALAAKRSELEEVDGLLEAKRTEWVRDRQEAETKRQALREQYAELKQQRDRLEAAGEDGTCPTCTRPLGGSLRSVLELLDAQIETVRVDGNYYKSRLEQLLEMPADVKELDEKRRVIFQEVGTLERRLMKVQLAVQELAQLGGDITDKEERARVLARELEAVPAGYDKARHDAVRREIDRLVPLDARATRLSAQIEREPHLKREHAQVLASMAELERRLGELRARRDSGAVADAAFTTLKAAYEEAASAMHAAELAAVSADSEGTAAESAHAVATDLARELAERQRALAELNGRKRLHDELDRGYTDLRTDLNFQLRPELSEIASRLLAELTDGRYAELELDDQYNIVVLEEGIPKPVISGGEEDLSNLVLRLAISQMIADRAGQPFSLLVLDEIFGSLDDLRRASVLDLLRHLSDRFEQVILITHIETVREGLDHVIEVRYDEESGASVVEQREGDATPAVAASSVGTLADTTYEDVGAAD
jgi:exonuclease SbcC